MDKNKNAWENRDSGINEETGRIEIGGEGAGSASDDAIAERAMDLAEIEGRPGNPFPEDFERARKELDAVSGSEPDEREQVPEGAPEGRDPSQTGGDATVHRANMEPDDENEYSERLVDEGVEEAEHEQMLEARRDESEKEGSEG